MPTPNKLVTVAIKVDSSFVRLLRANVELSELHRKDDLTPMQQLALVFLGEARGGLEGEIHASILPAWRPHIEVIHELRKVEVEGEGEAVTSGAPEKQVGAHRSRKRKQS